MPIKDNSELIAQIDSVIRVNGNREITPIKHNSIEKNIVDSFLNIKDGGNVIQKESGYTSGLTLISPYAFVYKDYVDNLFLGLGQYQGLWNATTNSPTITSGVGTIGDNYIVSVAGTTMIDGINTWSVGDKLYFNGTAWERIVNIIDLTSNVTGILPVANGGTSTNDRTLLDSTSVLSLDWQNRGLYDSSGVLSIDYTAKSLWNGVTEILSWDTSLINDQTGSQSINFGSRFLRNNLNGTVLDWNQSILYYSTANGGSPSFNWGEGYLGYASGTGAIDLITGSIFDTSEVQSMNFSLRKLIGDWSVTSGSSLKLYNTLDSNFTAIRSSPSIVSSYTITLPATVPLSGQILSYTGAGVYDWMSITSGLSYQGTWNATTNIPAISSGVGTNGHYYVVSVAGTTTIDGVNDWGVNDWIIFNGTTWQKIDNSEVATTWGSITGTLASQTDLITYLSTNYVNLGGSYANPSWITSLNYAKITGGTSAQFVKADGSLDSNAYLTSVTAATTYLKLDASNSPITGQLDLSNNLAIASTYGIKIAGVNWVRADATSLNLSTITYTFGAGTGNILMGGAAGNTAMSALSNNTILGYAATGTTGAGNVVIGAFASYNNIANVVANNVIIGLNAGRDPFQGSTNIAIGYFAGQLSIGSRTNTFLFGYNTGAAEDSVCVIGSGASPIKKLLVGYGGRDTSARTYTATQIIAGDYINSTSNNSSTGGDLWVSAFRARGTGVSGNVGFQYSPPVASGTTLQSWVDALTVIGTNGNIGLWGTSFGGGTQVQFWKNAGTVPTTNPTGGIIPYVEGDVMKYRKPSGVIVTLDTPASSGTTDYVFQFQRGGALTYSLLQADGGNTAYSNNMGFIVPTAMTLKDITITLGDSSASASETLSFIIRKVSIGIGLTGSATQLTLGAGSSIAQVDFVSGGALGARYYRNAVSLGNSIALAAGDIIFVETNNFAFWAVNDVKVEMRSQL